MKYIFKDNALTDFGPKEPKRLNKGRFPDADGSFGFQFTDLDDALITAVRLRDALLVPGFGINATHAHFRRVSS